jgi:hypothetical protein
MSDNLDKEVKNMGCGCSSGLSSSNQKVRGFLSRDERIDLLKEYKNDLEKEAQGVSERIKEIEVE